MVKPLFSVRARFYFRGSNSVQPIGVDAHSKAWVCAQSFSGIAGSNPAGVRFLALVGVVCCQVEFSGSARYFVQGSPTECLYVLVCVRACACP